jgi:hypothetical protein
MNWFKKKRKLDDKIHQRITALSEEGDTLAEKNDYSTALENTGRHGISYQNQRRNGKPPRGFLQRLAMRIFAEAIS